MNQKDLEHFHKKLQALGQRLREERGAVQAEALRGTGGEASGNLSNTPVHGADLGSDSFEQEVAVGLLENTQYFLREVADALRRIETGEYGRCTECGRDIPRERLEAVPQTPYCLECGERLEKEGGRPPLSPT